MASDSHAQNEVHVLTPSSILKCIIDFAARVDGTTPISPSLNCGSGTGPQSLSKPCKSRFNGELMQRSLDLWGTTVRAAPPATSCASGPLMRTTLRSRSAEWYRSNDRMTPRAGYRDGDRV